MSQSDGRVYTYLESLILPLSVSLPQGERIKFMDQKSFRKHLRKNLTPAEVSLWKLLKGKQFHNKKFRRQQQIDEYVVDFYCAEHKLIIELDGEVHKSSTHADEIRDSKLKQLGYTILRFENTMIFEEISNVLLQIESHLQTK